MIWLMIGSGGLVLRDSEPGCDRFRPGPANLTGQKEEFHSTELFRGDSLSFMRHNELTNCSNPSKLECLSPSSVDKMNDSPSGF